MLTQFSRTELLLGKESMEKLKEARVAIFGVGGVGGFVCEALVRSGIGAFDLIDVTCIFCNVPVILRKPVLPAMEMEQDRPKDLKQRSLLLN